MHNYSALGCFHIAGTYHAGSARIGYNNGQLEGQFLNEYRPNFTGSVNADCMGEAIFPDDRSYTFAFDKVLNKIFWEGRTSGNVWTKGIFFLFLFFRKLLVKTYRKKKFIWSVFCTLLTEIYGTKKIHFLRDRH